MTKAAKLAVILAVAAALALLAVRPERTSPIDPIARPMDAEPAERIASSPAPDVDPAPAPVPSPAAPPSVSLPERLQDPRALDPEPLKLRFAGPPFERQSDGSIRKTDVLARVGELNSEDHEPEADLQILSSVIGEYRAVFRQNPVAGENREVVEALTGSNPYKLVFLDPAHPALNAQRELTDRWNTPVRFHPVSGTHMEISSAGPDRQFGTADDIMAEEPVEIGGRGF